MCLPVWAARVFLSFYLAVERLSLYLSLSLLLSVSV